MIKKPKVIYAATRSPSDKGQSLDSTPYGIQQSVSYYNFTPNAVYVKPMMGFPCTVDPSVFSQADSDVFNYQGCFVIRVDIRCREDERASVLSSIAYMKQRLNIDLELDPFIHELQSSYCGNGLYHHITVNYVITENDFNRFDNGDGFLLGIFQTLISKSPDILRTPHPSNGFEIIMQRHESSADKRRELPETAPSVAMDIYLVEEPFQSQRRFIKVMGKVIEVRPIITTSLPTGIHVVATKTEGGGQSSEPEIVLSESSEYVTEENGFFDSILDAERGTDTKLIAQRLERENIFNKQERERKSDERKERSEEKTYKRRSTADTLKLVAMALPILTAVVKGATVLFKGLRALAVAGAAAAAAAPS